MQENNEKFVALERKLSSFEEMKLELDEYHDRLHQLFLRGLIDEEGKKLQKSDEKDENNEKEEPEMRFKNIIASTFLQ